MFLHNKKHLTFPVLSIKYIYTNSLFQTCIIFKCSNWFGRRFNVPKTIYYPISKWNVDPRGFEEVGRTKLPASISRSGKGKRMSFHQGLKVHKYLPINRFSVKSIH